MDKALFSVRSPYGKEIHSKEAYLIENLFTMAHRLMDAVAEAYPDECVHCCEVWTRTDPHTMNLLVTVF